MPINAGYEYGEAQKKVTDAKTPEEKIKALENLLSVSPSHKGAEKLRLEIKQKISKLKEKVEKERSKKAGGFSLSIKKEGAAQVALVGLPNSGKSTILNKLTGAKVEIADYPFTTKMPEIGVMDYNGIKIQIVEIPAIFEGFIESDKGPSFLAIARSADLIVVVVDGTGNCEENLKIIEEEFSKAFVTLKKVKLQKTEAEIKNCLVVVNKLMKNFKCPYPVCWIDDLKDAIWSMLDLVYVQTKTPGKKPDWPPVALTIGSTVRDLAEIVHKDFVKNFKYARIWGKSVKHDGSTVGFEHVLKEGDIVEIHTK
ncbi:50S ribosome-binding GTPase [Candidatus Woesearchaeota archaeon]|nr:50S ribosome-binding GTPase [Candidatus Woesearchaeota archaeon]